MTHNQCDGCLRGLPLDEYKNHIDTYPGGNFGCTKDRYQIKESIHPVVTKIDTAIFYYDTYFKNLCTLFVEKYYFDEDDEYENSESIYYIIGEGGNLCPDVIDVNEYFWSIQNIYIALKHDIPKQKLYDYYEYSLNKYTINKDGNIMNLYNFAFGDYIYTDEERKIDEENVKKSYNLLKECIQKDQEKI